MARVAGADIPDAKRVEIALTYIYGIGRTRSVKILEETKIDKNIRVKDLTDDQLVAIRDFIEGTFKVEVGSYEGIRHRKGLPVRGQRTKTNARTRKGPKRTVAGKKKATR